MLRRVDDAALRRRVQYESDGIDVDGLDPDPIRQFASWFTDAESDIAEPNAMVLSTFGPEGPSSRAVLLRRVHDGRFVFFTNRRSRKGRDIAAEPRVSLLFPWFVQHRQVRVDGLATTVDDSVSDAYFAERPPGSRAGAIASPQSEVIPSRAWLEEAVEAAASGPLDRPEQWGGYEVTPSAFEFWQGRRNRLHDRIRYVVDGAGWRRERLAP